MSTWYERNMMRFSALTLVFTFLTAGTWAQNIVGDWKGVLPTEDKQEISFRINEKNSGYISILETNDPQRKFTLMDKTEFTKNRLTIKHASPGIEYYGVWVEGVGISGSYKQNDKKYPLVLKKYNDNPAPKITPRRQRYQDTSTISYRDTLKTEDKEAMEESLPQMQPTTTQGSPGGGSYERKELSAEELEVYKKMQQRVQNYKYPKNVDRFVKRRKEQNMTQQELGDESAQNKKGNKNQRRQARKYRNYHRK